MKTFTAIKKYLLVIDKETDRGCTIAAVALLDYIVRDLLENCLMPIQSGRDPLDSISFDAKINLAYRLGILHGDNYRILCKINEIRNTFAHDHDADEFEFSKIKSKIQELKRLGIINDMIRNPDEYKPYQRDWNNLRGLFMLTVYLMCYELANTIAEKVTVKKRRKYDTILDWIVGEN